MIKVMPLNIVALLGVSLLLQFGCKTSHARLKVNASAETVELPSQICVVQYLYQSKPAHLCHSALVAPDTLLTSASCIDSSPSDSAIVNCQSGESRTLIQDQSIVHDSFESGSDENNLALLKLNRPMNIQPISIASNLSQAQSFTGSQQELQTSTCAIFSYGRSTSVDLNSLRGNEAVFRFQDTHLLTQDDSFFVGESGALLGCRNKGEPWLLLATLTKTRNSAYLESTTALLFRHYTWLKEHLSTL